MRNSLKILALCLALIVGLCFVWQWWESKKGRKAREWQETRVEMLADTRDSLEKYESLKNRIHEKAEKVDSIYEKYASEYDSISAVIRARGPGIPKPRDSLGTGF